MSQEQIKIKSKFPKLIFWFLKLLVLVVFLLGVSEYATEFFQEDKHKYELSENSSGVISRQETRSSVLGEEDQPGADGVILASEDFRIKHVAVGGYMSSDLISLGEGSELALSDIKSELYTAKDKDETKLLVSFRTSKAAISRVEYMKKGASVNDVIREDNFGTLHSLVLPSLDSDSIYTYTIRISDYFGVEKNSDPFVFYTGAPNVSLMDVLSGATEKVFGWAMKK